MAGYVIRQPGHPLLSGCKFFAVGDNATTITPIFPPAAVSLTGTVGGGATVGTLSPFPCIKGDGTNNIVTFSAFQNYFGSTSRSITVLGRFKANSSHIGILVSGHASPALNGWQILYSNSGGSETGYNFAVFSPASKFMEAQDGVGEAAIRNKNVFFGGVYDHSAHECYAWLRNESDTKATLRNTHTNSNSANAALEDWDIRGAANPLMWLEFQAPSFPFDGDVAWVAIFDRALTTVEIEQWSVDEAWPFSVDATPAPPLNLPAGFPHPAARSRRFPLQQPPITLPLPPQPSAAASQQRYAPPFRGGPFNRGPFFRSIPRPNVPLTSLPQFPTVLSGERYAPPFTGGPMRGPWQKRPTPGSQNPPTPVSPPDPPIIPANVYAPTFQGGPFRGGPFGPVRFVPAPVFTPTPPADVPTPPSVRTLQFVPRDVGPGVDRRLRAHSEKVADIINSYIRQGVFVQVSDKDWELNLTTASLPASGLTGTFNSGSFGTG